jgi:integrase
VSALGERIPPASVNGLGLRLALKRKVLTQMPAIELLKENNVREGFVERSQYEAVAAHLPQELSDFARFAFLTGWRRKEVATLTWGDVDVEGRVIRLRGSAAKNGKGRMVAIEGALREIIERRAEERGTHSTKGVTTVALHVFHRGDGRRIKEFRSAWWRACEKAGVPGLLFHDLRRSAVRNMVRAGVPETVAMRISGHLTRSVFDRYNITSEKDIQEAMRKTQAYLDAQTEAPKVVPIQQSSGGGA